MLLLLFNPPQTPLQMKLLACYTNYSINDKPRWEIPEEKNLDFCLPKAIFSVPCVPLQPQRFSVDELMFGAVIFGVINGVFCGANTSSALSVLGFLNYLSAFDDGWVRVLFLVCGKEREGKINHVLFLLLNITKVLFLHLLVQNSILKTGFFKKFRAHIWAHVFVRTDTAWCFQRSWTSQVSLENPELPHKKKAEIPPEFRNPCSKCLQEGETQ